jgi:hypothetical protein
MATQPTPDDVVGQMLAAANGWIEIRAENTSFSLFRREKKLSLACQRKANEREQ